MAEDQSKKEDQFGFTPEGEALGYISLDQARVLAMRTARETPGAYGRRFRSVLMAFEVIRETETEDHYVVTLSFRPEGEFTGQPGQEQFFIEKEGNVAFRQVLAVPRREGERRFPVIPVAIGLVVVGIAAAVGVVAAIGGQGGDERDRAAPAMPAPPAGVVPGETPRPTPVGTSNLVARPPQTTGAGQTRAAAAPTATSTVALPLAPRATPLPAPAPTAGPPPTPVAGAGKVRTTPTPVPETPASGVPGGMRRGATISGRATDVDTGLPIAGAEISAENTAEGGPGSGGRTGADGSYTLQGVAPGSYRIVAWVPDQGYVRLFYDRKPTPDTADFVTVTGAVPVDGIDFRLKLGASISGRVTDQETGLPIANVQFGAGPVGKGNAHISWAGTDDNGNYVLRGLPEGAIQIDVNDGQGYVRETRTVTVAGQQEVRGINFRFQRGATISGRVTDQETGLPVSNVKLDARQVGGDSSSWAWTDDSGNYALRGIPQGAIPVQVTDSQGYVGESRTVTVTGREDVTGIDFGLKPGASISGRVTDQETGLPIANVQFGAALVGQDHISWAGTDASGSYTLRGLPEGVIRIDVNDGQGYIGQSRTVTVAGREKVGGIDFSFQRGASISGRVTDRETGLPIPNVQFGAGPVGKGNAHISWAGTDDNGNYVLRGLPEGAIQIDVNDGQGYVRETRVVTVGGREEISGIDFGLKPGATISGKVVDGETGLPVPGMEIRAAIADGRHVASARTDDNGNYTLRGVPDGIIQVIAFGQGYIEQRRTVTVEGGKDVARVDF